VPSPVLWTLLLHQTPTQPELGERCASSRRPGPSRPGVLAFSPLLLSLPVPTGFSPDKAPGLPWRRLGSTLIPSLLTMVERSIRAVMIS